MFDVFQNVLAEVQKELSEMAFKTWFKNVTLVELDKEAKTATIGVPNVFLIKTLEDKYSGMLLEAFKHNNIELEHLDFVIKSSKNTKVKAREVRGEERVKSTREIIEHAQPLKMVENKATTGLSPQYTLDNFVVGSSNELAAGVAKLIVQNPGDKRFNPFFLYGGPGLGKTHLVQAIGNAIVEKDPSKKVLYVTTNQFYSEFINALMKKRGEDFVKKYRALDVLIVDDIQMIMGKDRSQEEFFNIFNDLHLANKQIIITSDRLPEQIKTLDPRLSSRLRAGGAYDIQFPGFEDRCAILKAKAEFMGQDIEDAAIEYLAENIKTNIRELDGAFQQLMLMVEIKGMSPLELINEGYITSTNTRRPRNVTARTIVEKVAKYYNLTVVEMTGRSRVSNIKTARQVAMYLMSKDLGMSTPKIAPEVGVKDHTTVMNGIKKIERDQKNDLRLRDQVEQIRESL